MTLTTPRYKPSKEALDILRKVQTRLTEKKISIIPTDIAILLGTIEQGIKQYNGDKDYSEDSFVGMLVWAIESGEKQ